jgi:hypothetical protein
VSQTPGRRIVLIVGAVAIATWAVVAGILLARTSDHQATRPPATAASAPRPKPSGLPSLAFSGAARVRVAPLSDSDELRLHALAKAANTYATKHDAFLVAESGLVPESPCCERPLRLCERDASRWSGDPWRSLAFDLDHSTPFQYGYSGTKERFTVIATGDPECDGRSITYIAEGTLDATGKPGIEFFSIGSD